MSKPETMPAKCGRCGADLPPNAPEGLCPRCVVALNLATETDYPTGDVGPHGTIVVKPAPQPPPPVEEIAKLFPQLEILETLGRGGMGAVYKARQPGLDRIVALKILSPEKQGDPHFAGRFQREARTLARLHHPNIVTVFEFGEVQGNFYLLMEFVDGLTLRQLFQTRKLSPAEALAIVPKICEALQYAHQQGVVHRDIKPENILIDKPGRVKIADFGIAKLVGQQAPGNLTDEKQVIGTPHYMAPEQIEKPQEVDHRADIYSLGVVFYEMLTGELPIGKFQAPSQKVQVDVRLDDVVLRALAKEPERRYQQASHVKTAVETIATSPSPGSSRCEEAPSLKSEVGSAKSEVMTGGPPRLSWTALAGACWAAVCLLVAVPVLLRVHVPGVLPGPFIVLLLPLAIIAPVGVTILGWIAVWLIRRSGGRIYGLWLAVFDGLLFPLLLLDGVIGSLFVGIVRGVAVRNFHATGPVLLALVVMVIVDILIIRRVWRAVKKPINGVAATPGQPAPGTAWAKTFVVGAVALLLGIVVIGLVIALVLPWARFRTSRDDNRSSPVFSEAALRAPVEVRTRVFEVDKRLADEVAPSPPRPLSGKYSLAQLPRVHFETLLNGMLNPPGLLSENQRPVNDYPKVADTWSYSTMGGTGGGSGFIGVERRDGAWQLRTEYHVSHDLGAKTPVDLQIFSDGPHSKDYVTVFLIPFVHKDGGDRYLVVSFDVLAREPVAVPEKPPLIVARVGQSRARLQTGMEIEIAAVAWTRDGQTTWWKTDGSPLETPPGTVIRPSEFDVKNGRVTNGFFSLVFRKDSAVRTYRYQFEPDPVMRGEGEIFRSGSRVTWDRVETLAYTDPLQPVPDRITCRVSLAVSAPWTVAVFDGDLVTITGAVFRVGFHAPRLKGRGMVLPVECPPELQDCWIDAQALLSDGKRIQAHNKGDGAVRELEFSTTPSKVKEYRLEFIPWHHVEFRDIALKAAPGS